MLFLECWSDLPLDSSILFKLYFKQFHCFIEQPEGEEDPVTKKRSNHAQRKIDARKSSGKLDQHLDEQFNTGRLYGKYNRLHEDSIGSKSLNL